MQKCSAPILLATKPGRCSSRDT